MKKNSTPPTDAARLSEPKRYEYIISHLAQGFTFKGKVHLALPDDGPLCGASSECWIPADQSDMDNYGVCRRCTLKAIPDPKEGTNAAAE